MNHISSVVLVIALILSTSIAAQDLTFEEYNPKSTLVIPGSIVKKAKFPFIDVHGHQYRMPEQNLEPVILAMDTLNMGIMVNLSGRSGTELQKSVKNIADHYPNRFVVFANVNFNGVGEDGWADRATDQLAEDVKKWSQGIKGL